MDEFGQSTDDFSAESDRTEFDKTVSSSEREISTPLSIDRYRIERVLGAGGFGTVFLGFDEQLLRDVAIKVPHAIRAKTPDFRKTFLSGSTSACETRSPQYRADLRFFGGTETYPCYLVSKYIDGDNLARKMPTLNWSWERRAEVIALIAEALHCAHQAGLVHRDVKPGNVLIDESGRPFLADFGLALSDQDYHQPDSGSRVGTLMYMSPEQVRGESHLVDGRADIFSLGVMMYQLLTGERPFSGKNSKAGNAQYSRARCDTVATVQLQRSERIGTHLPPDVGATQRQSVHDGV